MLLYVWYCCKKCKRNKWLNRRKKKRGNSRFYFIVRILIILWLFLFIEFSVFIIRFRSCSLYLSFSSVNSYICPEGNDALALKIKPDIFCIYWLELLKFYPVFVIQHEERKKYNIIIGNYGIIDKGMGKTHCE